MHRRALVVLLALVALVALALLLYSPRREDAHVVAPHAAHDASGARAEPKASSFSAQRDPPSRLLAAERIKCAAVFAALAAARGHAEAPSMPRQLPALATDEALLSLYDDGHHVHRFVRRYAMTSQLRALDSAKVAQAVIVARDLLEHGSLDGDQRALFGKLAQLYQLLLADAERYLHGATHLSISVNGLLRALPFHALLRRAGAAEQFVGARWAVTYQPCFAWRRAPLAPQQAVVLAPAYGNARQLARMLEGAQAEVRAIAPRFPNNAFYQGVKVNVEQLSRGLRDPHAVVHYVGHALSDLDDARSQSALVLSGGKEVGVGQLARRGVVSAPLVVLASCSAGYAARFRDGARKVSKTNLVEALLAAGAGGVVASSWVVKDRQSARSMRVFYQHLRSLGPAAAMQRAYRHQIARIKPPHPRFWGAYAVYNAARWR